MTLSPAASPGPLAAQVVAALRRRGETVAVAESCTGGWLGKELTAGAGASDVFWGGIIAYDDSAKQRLAGVPAVLMAADGAVSESVALALADGLRARAHTDWAVSITGIAGPDGGSEDKPVGTVWVAVAGPDATTATRRRFEGDRTDVRVAAVEGALGDLLGRLDQAGTR